MDWSHAQKNALKTSLGVTLAYAIAMWLNWDHPLWAGLGVAKIINPNSPGQEYCRNVWETLGHFWTANSNKRLRSVRPMSKDG